MTAAKQDMGVFIISPNDKGGLLYDPPEPLKALTAPLHPVNLNERWLLSQPEVHTLSIGLSEINHLEVHLQSLGTPHWGEAEKQADHRLQTAAAPSPFKHCGTCNACLPCPKGIDIPELFRIVHLADCFGMEGYAKLRYSLMVPGNHWIPGAPGSACNRCGDCLPRCPENLDIPTLLFRSHSRLNTLKKGIIFLAAKIYQHLPEQWIERLVFVLAFFRRWLSG